MIWLALQSREVPGSTPRLSEGFSVWSPDLDW